MYSLNETLFDQSDLIALCKDRPLSYKEIFPVNEFYGMNHILKEYAGLPQSYLLKVICPHGISLHDGVWDLEIKNILPYIYYYSDARRDAYQKHNLKKIYLSGAHPYLYVKKMLGAPESSRKGTLFFPAHSTQHLKASVSHKYLAEKLLSLADSYLPITVSMYWHDITLGHHLHYQENGFNVVSAGHMYDPHFLYRLHHLCSMHEYASSNVISGSCFYSIANGCKYFLMEETDFIYRDVKHNKSEKPARPDEAIVESFLNSQDGNTAEQIAWVNDNLGVKYLKQSGDLKQEFLETNKIFKKIYYVNHSNNLRYTILLYPINYFTRVFKRYINMLCFFVNKLRIYIYV